MRRKKKLLLKIDEAIIQASIKKAEGIIAAMRNYKPIPADFVEPLPEWAVGGYEFMQKYGLLDMSGSIVKIACGYRVIYATDYAIEIAERFCCDNWQYWLEGITSNA